MENTTWESTLPLARTCIVSFCFHRFERNGSFIVPLILAGLCPEGQLRYAEKCIESSMYGKNFTDAKDGCPEGKKFEDENIGLWLEVRFHVTAIVRYFKLPYLLNS